MAEKLKKSALIFRPIQNSVEIYKVVDINFQSARFQCCNNSYFIVFLIPTIIDILCRMKHYIKIMENMVVKLQTNKTRSVNIYQNFSFYN